MAKTEASLESIEQRLDIVIQLLCLMIDRKKIPTIGDQIDILSERGLSPSEVGRIVGREANYVSASRRNRKQVKKNAP